MSKIFISGYVFQKTPSVEAVVGNRASNDPSLKKIELWAFLRYVTRSSSLDINI